MHSNTTIQTKHTESEWNTCILSISGWNGKKNVENAIDYVMLLFKEIGNNNKQMKKKIFFPMNNGKKYENECIGWMLVAKLSIGEFICTYMCIHEYKIFMRKWKKKVK